MVANVPFITNNLPKLQKLLKKKIADLLLMIVQAKNSRRN